MTESKEKPKSVQKGNSTLVGTPTDKIEIDPELQFQKENKVLKFKDFLGENTASFEIRSDYDKKTDEVPRSSYGDSKMKFIGKLKKLRYWLARHKLQGVEKNIMEEFSTGITKDINRYGSASFLHPDEPLGIKRGIYLGKAHMGGMLYHKVGVPKEKTMYLVKPQNMISYDKE